MRTRSSGARPAAAPSRRNRRHKMGGVGCEGPWTGTTRYRARWPYEKSPKGSNSPAQGRATRSGASPWEKDISWHEPGKGDTRRRRISCCALSQGLWHLAANQTQAGAALWPGLGCSSRFGLNNGRPGSVIFGPLGTGASPDAGRGDARASPRRQGFAAQGCPCRHLEAHPWRLGGSNNLVPSTGSVTRRLWPADGPGRRTL